MELRASLGKERSEEVGRLLSRERVVEVATVGAPDSDDDGRGLPGECREDRGVPEVRRPEPGDEAGAREAGNRHALPCPGRREERNEKREGREALPVEFMERDTRVELATSTLAR